MYDHQPTKVIAYLQDGHALATNATEDTYYLVEPNGTQNRIPQVRAAVLYQQRLIDGDARAVEEAHKRRSWSRIQAQQNADRAERRRRWRRERRRRAAETAHIPKITKHIRIADKERELEDRIQELEATLARKEDQNMKVEPDITPPEDNAGKKENQP